MISVLQRNAAIQEQAAKLDDHKLDNLMLTATMEHQLDTLIKKVQEFNEIVLSLRENLCTFRQMWANSELMSDVHETFCASFTSMRRL